MPETSARDRLLHAAAELMDASGTRELSTRTVCDAAGVSAPTLYHHFGSKQGLIDAVINHGFSQYLATDADTDADPVAAIRAGWDRHVAYGLDHPRFYALLYGSVEPGTPCAITTPALAQLTALLERTAADGRLALAPADAALALHAANVGVTLTLIGQPPADRSTVLSDLVREATLARVLTAPSTPAPEPRRVAALTLRQLVAQDASALSPGEAALLGELLDRLAR